MYGIFDRRSSIMYINYIAYIDLLYIIYILVPLVITQSTHLFRFGIYNSTFDIFKKSVTIRCCCYAMCFALPFQ